eukprot:1696844-Rhodomonas_salina.5
MRLCAYAYRATDAGTDASVRRQIKGFQAEVSQLCAYASGLVLMGSMLLRVLAGTDVPLMASTDV